MVIREHVRSWLLSFAVITLLGACSSEAVNPAALASGGASGTAGRGGVAGGQAGVAGAAGGAAGMAGQGGQAGDSGSAETGLEAGAETGADSAPEADAPAPTGCEQCKCANQAGQSCGPSGQLFCPTLQPMCCFCPSSCFARPTCIASPGNPIGGSTWWCCGL